MAAKKPDLVDDILAVPRSAKCITWFDKLDKDKQSIALAVRAKMPKQLGLYQPIAKRLIDKLGLQVTPGTVAVWLKNHE